MQDIKKVNKARVPKKKTKLSKDDLIALKIGAIFTVLLVVLGLTLWGLQRYQIFKAAKIAKVPSQTIVVREHKKIAATPPTIPSSTTLPAKTALTAPVPKTPAPVVTPAPNSPVSSLTPVTTPAPAAPIAPSAPAVTPPAQASYTSLNWSGYLAANGRFTGVSGSWIVPNVAGNGYSVSADAAWIGIGGVTSTDLIQVGTFNRVTAAGQVIYSAFYEMLPDSAQMIPTITVSAGDIIVASIVETTASQWSLSITDQTSGQTYANTFQYTSTYSSAEWIEEDPSYATGKLIPLDNFRSVTFSASSTIVNGATANLVTGQAQAIYLVNKSGQRLATPSTISSDSAGFVVTQ